MRRRLALLLVTGLLALPATAAAVPDGSTVLIDQPTGFVGPLPFDGVADSDVTAYSLSADGCFVVFQSSNDVLFAGDVDSVTNVYRLDRCSPGHPLELVSSTTTGAPGTGDSSQPTVSADGRYVAFRSSAKNLHPDMPAAPFASTVVVKDMQTRGIEIAARADGANGAVLSDPFSGVISGNGRAVAFNARGVVDAFNADGIAGQDDAYVRHLDTGRTYLASINGGGTAGGGVGSLTVPSYDGTSVAFASSTQLLATDVDQGTDAYLVRGIGGSMSSQQVTFSINNNSRAVSVGQGGVTLSSDGTRVGWANNFVWHTTCDPNCDFATEADFPPDLGIQQFIRSISFAHTVSGTTPVAPVRLFWTTGKAIAAEDQNSASDIYARVLANPNPGVELLTTGTFGGGAVGGTATDDAAVVVFDSPSPDLPGTDSRNNQTFVRAGGQTSLISQPESLPPRRNEVDNALLASGRSVSADGRRVAFLSNSPFLGVQVKIDSFGGLAVTQAFVRDIVTGTTTPVSLAPDGSPPDDRVNFLGMDGAGDQFVFSTRATNLVPGVPPSNGHVYLHDVRSGETRLLDRGPGGQPLGADAPQISADGTKVSFISNSPELPGGDGMNSHVYVLDLATGNFTVVDRTADGTLANGSAFFSHMSANGNRVAFQSGATNLGGGTSGTDTDLYLKDLTTGQLFWVSRPEDGSTNHSNAFSPSVSDDGRLVAFANTKAGFGFGADALSHVYVHQPDTGATRMVPGGPPGSNEFQPSLAGDGSRVGFTLFSGGRTVPAVSDLDGLNGSPPVELVEPTRLSSATVSLNATGRCVAFDAIATNLTTPGFGADFQHVFLRALGGDCPATAGPPGGQDEDPELGRVRMTNRVFAVASRNTPAVAQRRRAPRRGTAFRFTLSEAARTTITIHRKQAGRRRGRRCVKPRRGLRRRCTRFVRAHRLVRNGTTQGVNRVPYTGRVRRKALRPGPYRATLLAIDADGNRSEPRRISFRVVRAPRRR